jgi:hypothetical protein
MLSTQPRRALPALLLSSLLCLALALTLPAAAAANCGGVKTAQAERKVNPGGRAPLAIGDSTMLLAIPYLAKAGFRVNARGCRMWDEGMRLLRKEKRRGRLPHLVLIALGADGEVSKRDIHAALNLLGKKRVLALVTPIELGGWSGSDAANVRDAFHKSPRRVILLDWVKYSQGTNWFQPDHLHLTFAGAAAFANFARKAIPWARSGEMPNHTYFPRK